MGNDATSNLEPESVSRTSEHRQRHKGDVPSMTITQPPRAHRKLLSLIAVGVLAVVLSGCSPSSTSDSALANEMISSVRDFVAEWNQNNLRWVTALTDPEVSYDAFVSTQHDVGLAQLKLLTNFDIWVQSLDPAVRPAVVPLLENYQGRFQAANDELFPAALSDDDAAFEAALNRYQSFSLPENVEPAFRTFTFHPVIADALRSGGIEPEVFLQSIMRSFGS